MTKKQLNMTGEQLNTIGEQLNTTEEQLNTIYLAITAAIDKLKTYYSATDSSMYYIGTGK
jgi:hypothetical protein